MNQSYKMNNSASEQDFQIDNIIEKKLNKSKDLQHKLYKQKREMVGKGLGETSKSPAATNMSYFLREIEKPKRK